MPQVKRSSTGLVKYTAPGRRVQRTFRKRVARRSYSRGKRGRVLPNYTFHRWITVLSSPNVTNCTYDGASSILECTSTNSTCRFSTDFIFGDLPNFGEFTTLFDSYMITGVMFQIKMISNPYSAYPINGTTSSSTINA